MCRRTGAMVRLKADTTYADARYVVSGFSRTCSGILAVTMLLVGAVALAQSPKYHVGRTPTDEDTRTLGIMVAPDGSGLPPGSGTAVQGKEVFAARCASCHGQKGAGGDGPALVGGVGTLATPAPKKTVGSYWPYATTVFDYVRRAMPWTNPKSLTNDEVYAVSAYLLNLNGIIGENDVMNAQTLAKVSMPNKDGFIPFPRWPPK